MKNKKIYEDKIKPLSSLLINYYGEEYKDRINHNFDNLVYNFDDIFTSSYDILSSNPSVVKGLIENLGFIKAKDKYNLLFEKYRLLIINRIKTDLNIDISNNYDLFFNNYMSLKKLHYIVLDDQRLYDYSKIVNISSENIQTIYKIIYAYKQYFYKELLSIDYFKNLYKNLDTNFNVFANVLNEIFEKEPFVARFRDRKDNDHNYLYFPYLDYLNRKINVDVSLLHELVHLTESDETKNKELRIGLEYNKKNKFVNEVRTDLTAMNLKDKLNTNIFDDRDIKYNSIYLRIAKEYLYFFKKYEKVFSNIAISGDLDKLTYYFGNKWNDFSTLMDNLHDAVIKELILHEGNEPVKVNFNTTRIHNTINDLSEVANNKLLILERK